MEIQPAETVAQAVQEQPIVQAPEPVVEKPTEASVVVEKTVTEAIAMTEPEIDKIALVVNAWIAEYICNSPASRDVLVYNHISSVKDNLIQKIKEVI
jgi:hypothetical protein